MEQSTRDIGRWGEEQAVLYLKNKGYEILEQNYFAGNKELDIIAKVDNFLVIVEVKTRESAFFQNPEDAVSNKKIRNIMDASEIYIEDNEVDLEVRFDVISIVLKSKGKFDLQHFEDAFLPPLM